MAEHLPEGARVGIDPFVHTIEAAEKLRKKLRAAGKQLVALGENPVDGVWGAARPAAPDVSAAGLWGLWLSGGRCLAPCCCCCMLHAACCSCELSSGSAELTHLMPPVLALQAPLRVHATQWAGQSVSDKLAGLRQQLAEAGAGALLVTMLGASV